MKKQKKIKRKKAIWLPKHLCKKNSKSRKFFAKAGKQEIGPKSRKFLLKQENSQPWPRLKIM